MALDPIEISIEKLLHSLVNISKPSKRSIYVAYSGGMDSSVLLHACVNLREMGVLKLPIVAWHINHQLQPAADEWEKHCQDEAEKHLIEFKSNKLISSPDKQSSMEMFARRSRYDIWQKGLNPGDILLQAHHQRDQAETLLMRIVRASPNLKGIPQVRDINSKEELQLSSDREYKDLEQKVLVARPLINLSKQSITRYAEKHNIKYINDPSNSDNKYERNYIRNEILPLLEEKWPGAEKSIATSAHQLSSYNNMLIEKQSQLLEDFCTTPSDLSKDSINLSRDASSNYRPALQLEIPTSTKQGAEASVRHLYNLAESEFALVVKAWLKLLSMSPPAAIAIKELQRQLKDAALKNETISGKGIEWQTGAIRAHKGILYAAPPVKQVGGAGSG